MKVTRTFLTATAAASLASCTGDEGANNAAANESRETANQSAMANDPSNPFGEAEMRMNERMRAATGASASETWARKMIAHHQGAIDMSEILIRQGGDAEVVAMARRTADMQRREIEELETLLAGGQPAAEAGAEIPAAPTPQPKAREAAPAPRERPTPQPKPKQPEPDPHAGHDMDNMANMSRD